MNVGAESLESSTGPARLTVQPLAHPVAATVHPPGSKSLTNRALVCAALANGRSQLHGALDSEDTRVMAQALAALGIGVRPDWPAARIEVDGCGGIIPQAAAKLDVANSGTTARFLTALVALGNGRYLLDGTPRMRERPIRDLLDALKQLGVNAQTAGAGGCPPVVIESRGLDGGPVRIRGDVSSQFLSGLLLASPYARQSIEIAIDGPLVSAPYVRSTLAVMQAFGVGVQADADRWQYHVASGQAYSARDYRIEPDASAASYFWAAAAVTGSTITVAGLNSKSLQGDVAFCDVLAKMGCVVSEADGGLRVAGRPLQGVDVDMNAISDTVQTLAAVALFAKGPTAIRNVAHIRHKETDRIAALAAELRKLGAAVEERADGLCITPGALRPASIETYDDHRMAMSMAVVGLVQPGIEILDPACTAKTYPGFFADLALLGSAPALRPA